MSKNSDLGKRLVVAVVLIAVAFAALWFGGFVFWLLVAIGGVLMIGEWAGLSDASPGQKRLSQYVLTVPLAILAPIAAGPSFLALGLIVAGTFFLGAVTRKTQLALGMLYVGLPVLGLLVLRSHPQGFLLTLWAMALVWASDSGAYFAGRAIGGPKLAPAISPNKTWAGFFGGLVASGVFAAILVVAFGLPVILALFTPLLAVLSQIGDLYESHLKRRAGVKDSGNLLPGHGGVLDRLDGLVAVAPVAAVLVLAFA
ncbi:phosphatidate cytidylyltransferase [Sphingomonas sp. MMS12-HWE2-04]|uniref:phosphatidate cytidylyltransferase n=1 Tax=Sphingomonas sp. MMS12-HWE2-04 TaxID=3234199 RepID=UPI00384D61F7